MPFFPLLRHGPDAPCSSLAALPARWLRALGLCQSRCVFCLRPFSAKAAPQNGFDAPGILGGSAPLCADCAALLRPFAGARCPRCGTPAPDQAQGSALCGACLQTPPPWNGLAFHGLYGGALRHALLRLKFDGHLYLAPLLANFLLEAAACLPRPDALTAVPQHPDHLRRRGYNQAHEMAKALRDLSGLALQAHLLTRDVPGPEQARLDARDRRRNVLHSFAAAPDVAGMRVWLVDDIMTTGSTLAAATRALLEGGAARVDVLFIARTVRDAPLADAPPRNTNAT